MTLYKRKDSPYYRVKFAPIKGELKPFTQSTGTTNKRQAQQYHYKLKNERWEQDRLGVSPAHVGRGGGQVPGGNGEQADARVGRVDAALVPPTSRGERLGRCESGTARSVRAKRAKGVTPGTVNRYMALVRSILRRACFDWEWIDRVPKVGMMRDQAGRVRALTRDEYTRLLAELPDHLRDMAQFSVATGLRQSNVTRLQWKQVSLGRRHLWVAADQHKNGRALAVLLNEIALEVLVRRQGDHPTHVFTYEGAPIVQVNTKA